MIANLDPRPGEEPSYAASPTPPIREDYALIRLTEGFTSDRRKLTLAGTTTIGTHAATEFVCREEKLKELLAALDYEPGAGVTPFEAVLRVKVSGGVPVETDVVTVRSHTKEP